MKCGELNCSVVYGQAGLDRDGAASNGYVRRCRNDSVGLDAVWWARVMYGRIGLVGTGMAVIRSDWFGSAGFVLRCLVRYGTQVQDLQ